MLQHGGEVFRLNIRHGMGGAFIANQQAVALGEIARARCLRMHVHLPAISV